MTLTVPAQRTRAAAGRLPRAVSSLRVACGLAPGEARRLLLHPVFLAGFALNLVLVAVVAGSGPRDAFGSVTMGSTYYSGVFAYFAANLVATRERRSRSGELLAPLPGTAHERTLALCLAALAPALLNTALVLAMHAQLALRDLYLVAPQVGHVVQGPLTVLGGALLGIMVARWGPYPGVAAVVMVAMVAWDVFASLRPAIAALSTAMNWESYRPGGHWHGLDEGSPTWHAVYLACLCAMAAAGALLATTPHRRRVLAAGAVLTALAAAAGGAAIP